MGTIVALSNVADFTIQARLTHATQPSIGLQTQGGVEEQQPISLPQAVHPMDVAGNGPGQRSKPWREALQRNTQRLGHSPAGYYLEVGFPMPVPGRERTPRRRGSSSTGNERFSV